MIKVGSTQVKHVIVKSSSSDTGTELKYVLDKNKNMSSNGYLYARPFTLTFTQTNCTFSVYRKKTYEPSASIGNVSSGGQIYYGDELEIRSLTGNFGYKNPWVKNGTAVVGSSTITVTSDITLTSGATAIILCKIQKGTWTGTVGTNITYFGYKIYGPDTTHLSTSGTLTVYLKDMPDNATGIAIIGKYNNNEYWLTNQYFRYSNGTMYDSYQTDVTYTVNVIRSATVKCGGSGSSSLTYDWWYGKTTSISCSINLLPSGYFYCPPKSQRTMSGTWSGTIRFNGGTERSGTLPFYCDIWPNDDTKVSKGSSDVNSGDTTATAVADVYMGADRAKDNYASATVYLSMDITASSSSYYFSKFTYSQS